MKSSVYELENLIDGFKLSCQTEGKSPRTIEWYSSFLSRFVCFLKFKEFPTDIGMLGKNHVKAFILYLQTEVKTPFNHKPLSSSSVQGYVRTLKVFFAWATREDYIQSNPMTKIPVTKSRAKVINTFSPEQIVKISSACQDGANAIRDIAMLLLMLDCGLRVSELVNLKVEDVNLAEGYVKISAGKGNKDQMVPIGSFVQKMIWKYLNHSRPQPMTEKIARLFLSGDGLPLTRNGV